MSICGEIFLLKLSFFVFFQNRRLVSSRHRHEIYALNQIMTELERDNYQRVCRERGYTMDE